MVIICLTSDQWKKLEPHLPEEGVSTKLTEGWGLSDARLPGNS
jgi:hypothetical protein